MDKDYCSIDGQYLPYLFVLDFDILSHCARLQDLLEQIGHAYDLDNLANLVIPMLRLK